MKISLLRDCLIVRITNLISSMKRKVSLKKFSQRSRKIHVIWSIVQNRIFRSNLSKKN